MPVAHYKIDSSLLVLRTGSILGCQCGLWRGEMRIKLLLIDVLDSPALFVLCYLQQVSEYYSRHQCDFCRQVQCSQFVPCWHPTLWFLLGERSPAVVQCDPQSHHLVPRALKNVHAPHWGVSTLWHCYGKVALFRRSLGALSLAVSRTSPKAAHMQNEEGTELIRSL